MAIGSYEQRPRLQVSDEDEIFSGNGDIKLTVTGLGGTQLCHLNMPAIVDGKVTIMPTGTTKDLVTRALRMVDRDTRQRFQSIVVRDVEPRIDSSDLKFNKRNVNPSLEQMIDYQRELVEQSMDEKGVRHVHANIFGTDQLVWATTASHQALPQTSITHLYNCSQQHQDVEGTDAFSNMGDLLRFATKEELTGKIGVVFRRSIYAALGLRKTNLGIKKPFLSRARRIAKTDPLGSITFAPDRKYHMPIGNLSRAFQLEKGMKIEVPNPGLDYSDLLKEVRSQSRGSREDRTFNALFWLAPGGGNLVSDPEDHNILSLASQEMERMGIPFLVGGQALSKLNGDEVHQGGSREQEGVYVGNAGKVTADLGIENLISVGGMTEADALVVVSWALADARTMSMKGRDTVQYVKQKILEYPFK